MTPMIPGPDDEQAGLAEEWAAEPKTRDLRKRRAKGGER